MSIVATFARPLTRLMAIVNLARTVRNLNPDTSGLAMNATPWLKPDGVPLQVRAHRIHNRDPKAAAIYLRKHQILDRGRCSDAD